ncbi:MAG TPA: SH3 domain-containing protein, partial [Caldilineaceae bacterium]|nr:SH3 domain-containing protein [Caldilineaceae bacterium]
MRILSPIRPADSPLRGLKRRLSRERAGEAVRPEGPANVAAEQTAANAYGLIERWLEGDPKRKLLLVVDQLEELVTISRDWHESEQFIILIGRLLDQYAAQLHVVFTLRSDFEPQFAITPLAGAIRQRWAEARFLVRPMSPTELREVVEGPATQSVLEFDPPTLIDELVNEVLYTPGALSMLSFTLSELYLMYVARQEAARSRAQTIQRTLTGADYAALGGVNGSLRKRATEVYEGLDAAHQATLQRVMLRMVAVEGNELARRRVPRAELVYPSAEENQRVATVLERLAAAQLVVEGSDDAGVAYVEPVHDALVRAWDKLLVWKREAEETLPLQRRLILAANEWQRAAEKNKSRLLWNNDPRLSQLQQVIAAEASPNGRKGLFPSVRQTLWPVTVATSEPTWLNQLETDFVEQSIARRIVGLTIAVILALMSLSLLAEFQRRSAAAERDNAAVERDNALDAQETAQAERDRAEQQSHEAERQAQLASQAGSTAEAERVAAETRLADALVIGNGLADLLTRQAPTATPVPGGTGGVLLPTPTFTPGDTPTPDVGATATTEALQAQLLQLQGTATAVAAATAQAGASQTAPLQDATGQLAYTTGEANLRIEPSIDSKVRAVLPAGAEMQIVDEVLVGDETEVNWYLVDAQGQTGYINRSLVSFEPPADASPTAAP